MTLEKAIEILDRYFNLHHNVPRAELDEAARLSIEALKRCQLQRTQGGVITDVLLPGETKD